MAGVSLRTPGIGMPERSSALMVPQVVSSFYTVFMGLMGALATGLGILDVVLSMGDRIVARRQRRRRI